MPALHQILALIAWRVCRQRGFLAAPGSQSAGEANPGPANGRAGLMDNVYSWGHYPIEGESVY